MLFALRLHAHALGPGAAALRRSHYTRVASVQRAGAAPRSLAAATATEHPARSSSLSPVPTLARRVVPNVCVRPRRRCAAAAYPWHHQERAERASMQRCVMRLAARICSQHTRYRDGARRQIQSRQTYGDCVNDVAVNRSAAAVWRLGGAACTLLLQRVRACSGVGEWTLRAAVHERTCTTRWCREVTTCGLVCRRALALHSDLIACKRRRGTGVHIVTARSAVHGARWAYWEPAATLVPCIKRERPLALSGGAELALCVCGAATYQ